MSKQSWLDETGAKSMLDDYIAQLESFTDAFADGRIEDHELERQEERVTALLKQIEPKLDDGLHAEVTRLLCELSAYNIMQTFYHLRSSAPHTSFIP